MTNCLTDRYKHIDKNVPNLFQMKRTSNEKKKIPILSITKADLSYHLFGNGFVVYFGVHLADLVESEM